MSSGGVRHWDDVPWNRRESGHIAGSWQSLPGDLSVAVGVQRVRIDGGKWSTPAHVEISEEEIVYVLDGSGLSWQDGACYELRPGDCVVHTAGTEAHTLRADDDGLEVLIFGQRHRGSGARLPRAGVSWGLGAWVRTGDPDEHPWKLESEAGEPEVAEPSERPFWVVNLGDVDVVERRMGSIESDWRDLARAAGSVQTGLKHVTVLPSSLAVPPHCHSAEEEIFVVLDGEGSLELTPSPAALDDAASGATPVRRGSTVARPAGTRVAHTFRAGPQGLRYLAYGTRDPNDMAYYPRSRKIFFRGLGVIARVEHVDYGEGEE